jgi:hypothetical protein
MHHLSEAAGAHDLFAKDVRLHVDRRSVLGLAALAERIKLFERQARRVHDPVAGGAAGIVAVKLQAHARGRLAVWTRAVDRREIDIPGGRRDRLAEEDLVERNAAFGR